MAKIDAKLIQELRNRTGLGMMDCKKALEATDGDIDKAVDELRKKGAAVAAKRSGKETQEGLVYAYIHPGDQLGVLLEINCETDFVARNEEVKQFTKDIAMHIAAMKPRYLSVEDVDPTFLAHERDIITAQLANSGKPEKIIAQIIEAKLKKTCSEICLLSQSFVKNDQDTVQQVLQNLIAKTGENIKIRRFARYEIGD
jgi:elongation factor Ts